MTSVAIGPPDQLDPRLLEHRRELTGYCYRMLGSSFDAEDAVQETMVRAWRGLADFEGRSALRSWLYRIATNVCLDQLSGRQRRALPMDLAGSPFPPVQASLAGRRPATAWVEPVLDRQVLPEDGDPAERAVAKESIRLAFVAALQHLPPRQRAVLILREVLRWKADEVAQLLDTTVASVNSALQRARATLAAAGDGVPAPRALDADHRELLARYVDAFERYDIEAFVSLLHEDATQHMPPFEMWLRGRDDIGTWMLGPGSKCRGSAVVPLSANGSPAFAQYRPREGGGREPWALHVLEVEDGRIAHISSFLDLDNDLFATLGLPTSMD
ncbi:sigma-70 family RNA polymerase sigma factor [Blastococcus haudaquaticus]|uniref:RNA polymerase sigma-70 factor, ECF subfamily n=1 Tax=Blastococcus haudaquaticus TaxID=1938745 RepID=A0A286H4R2_9ACTN|nr:sigma-70 family RNA polymerase sigma factor [Blastococcus haudaquaticus]SOE02274.1 RNA polymerase sigma-70 factor, ECF subfamily [Blastococcus haudaquaticus]